MKPGSIVSQVEESWIVRVERFDPRAKQWLSEFARFNTVASMREGEDVRIDTPVTELLKSLEF
jgi:hypothetical protein